VIRSVVTGSGSALPRTAVSNAELAKRVDTSDEWIVERTGIRQRYIAEPDETTSTLAVEASRKALDAAGLGPNDIDLIVLATATPDQTFPATATIVQHAIGCNGGIAFDVAAVCSGFLYALASADSMLRTGMAKRALVIGAETFSRILDWEDRTTCVLFGDGAGARCSVTRWSTSPRCSRRRWPKPAIPPTISTGSSRTRPTHASSTRRRANSGFRPRRWWLRSTSTPTPRPPLCRSRSTPR
jgi:3-oxoacyl-(acyl-carrier-protein) synthase III